MGDVRNASSVGARGEMFARNGRVDIFAGGGVAAAMAAEPVQVTNSHRAAHVHSSMGGSLHQPENSPQNRAPAGGRSSNARPDKIGHTRGNLHGAQQHTRLPGDADFLERVSLAEKRDDEASFRAGGASPDGPRSQRRGLCNPQVDYVPNTRLAAGGIQLMPNMGGNYDDGSKNVGAAGQSSSQAWRCSHNYMAHGAEGYGDFRSEHLALQSTSPQARGTPSRHPQTQSKVLLG